MLKNEVEAKDSVLITLKQKLNQAEKERDDLKLNFDKFQTSSKSLTELLANQTNSKHGLGYYSESDSKSLSPSPLSDRIQPSGEYHAVPPPITGNFMPSKPDLVFHTVPIAVETAHSAFTVQLSPAKPAQDISHATRPMAPIIEDWVSDLEDESEPNDPQSAPSFVQTSKNVKPSRHSVQATILAATSKPTTPKMLTKSKLVSVTATRLVSAAVPKIMITKPRHARSLNTKSNSIIRRHKTHNQSSKTSNSSPKVTAGKAQVVSVTKGKKGKWGNPQYALKDKGVIDSGCSRHMTGNMSYFQTNEKTGLGYNSHVFIKAMFDCENYYSSKSDCKSWPPSNLYDRFQPSGGYHDVPLPYTGTFMPPKPDLVFHTTSTAVETNHLAFNVQLSPTKPEQDLSHITKPSAPIIEDWVSDSEEESETKSTQFIPSFAQSSKHVKSLRHSDQPIATTIPAATYVPGIKREFSVPRTPQQNGIAERKNMTLIEAVRTMLADSLLPVTFWAEAVNTACYVQNR
nr:ribonuclease H-like domain-containing protein [Tanacetum cinerariifolium]